MILIGTQPRKAVCHFPNQNGLDAKLWKFDLAKSANEIHLMNLISDELHHEIFMETLS